MRAQAKTPETVRHWLAERGCTFEEAEHRRGAARRKPEPRVRVIAKKLVKPEIGEGFAEIRRVDPHGEVTTLASASS